MVSWDTSGTTVGEQKASQVIIEEDNSGNINPVVLDFIIQIVDGSINQPPVCTLNGSSINVVPVGQTFTMSATGTDPDGNDLTINDLGLPSGATLNPPTGTAGPEPLTTTFSWTPGPGDTGSAQAVTIVFADTSYLQSFCSFSIQVPANQAPTADADGPYDVDEGSNISLDGSLSSDPELIGKANFGFVSKYKKGKSTPDGQTEFQFQAGDLNFHSDAYEWLVVNQNATNAQFKGDGTVNGESAPNGDLYKFMIWAGDDNPDTFRIRIWYDDGGEIGVYDNGFDQPMDGRSVVIHTQGKEQPALVRTKPGDGAFGLRPLSCLTAIPHQGVLARHPSVSY